jgi:hypothetical protein
MAMMPLGYGFIVSMTVTNHRSSGSGQQGVHVAAAK